MISIDSSLSRKIITKLKAGTAPIEGAQYLNVGNDRWYDAAKEYFEDIKNDKDSLVRFIKGYIGEGKSHFLFMLRTIAFDRKWVVSYISSEDTPLNKFEVVYSKTIKSLTLPPTAPNLTWLPFASNKGAASLLVAFFAKIYLQVNDSGDKSGIYKMGVVIEVNEKVKQITATTGMVAMFASAVRHYVEAIMANNIGRMEQIASWMEGDDIRLPEIGIRKKVDRSSAKEMMRSLSLLVLESGLSGILVLLDEAERIIDQSKGIRKKSYGIIRDLLDNADDKAGMKSTIVYVAATPDMFESARGFAEYDALRSRLENASRFTQANLVDWRSVIIDLTRTPLPPDILLKIAYKIREIHSIAQIWNAKDKLNDNLIKIIIDFIENRPLSVSKPRFLCSYIATILEIIHQNPDSDIKEIITKTFGPVLQDISKRTTEQWQE